MRKNRFLPALIIAVGALMIAASVTYFAVIGIRTAGMKKENGILLDRLNTLIPDPRPGVIEEGRDTIMPALEVDGTDYIGILTIPAYKTEIPVASVWNEEKNRGIITRYYGSLTAYDLVLGADNVNGLFGFSKEITGGDSVFFTDTEGIIYTFTVEDVIHTKSITKDIITFEGLTIFVRSRSGSDFIVVYCK